MSDTLQDPTTDDRIDIRNLDGHETWRGSYWLNEVTTSYEPEEYDDDTLAAAVRQDRPDSYRQKHLRGVTS